MQGEFQWKGRLWQVHSLLPPPLVTKARNVTELWLSVAAVSVQRRAWRSSLYRARSRHCTVAWLQGARLPTTHTHYARSPFATDSTMPNGEKLTPVKVNTPREIIIGLTLGLVGALAWRAYHSAWRETIDNYYKGLEDARQSKSP